MIVGAYGLFCCKVPHGGHGEARSGTEKDMLVARELTERVIGFAGRAGLGSRGLRLGLLLNFHARLLKDGLRRFII